MNCYQNDQAPCNQVLAILRIAKIITLKFDPLLKLLLTRHLSNEDAGNYSVNVRNKYGEKVE